MGRGHIDSVPDPVFRLPRAVRDEIPQISGESGTSDSKLAGWRNAGVVLAGFSSSRLPRRVRESVILYDRGAEGSYRIARDAGPNQNVAGSESACSNRTVSSTPLS